MEHLDRDQLRSGSDAGKIRARADRYPGNMRPVSAGLRREGTGSRRARACLRRLTVRTTATEARFATRKAGFLDQPSAQEGMRAIDTGIDHSDRVPRTIEATRERQIGLYVRYALGQRGCQQPVLEHAHRGRVGGLELRERGRVAVEGNIGEIHEFVDDPVTSAAQRGTQTLALCSNLAPSRSVLIGYHPARRLCTTGDVQLNNHPRTPLIGYAVFNDL